jgi:mannose-6-phosphate isomerase-like protein (cupin superfamily)
MSDYAKVNLKEIDDSSQNPDVEAHFARKYLESRDLGVSLFSYPPNYQAKTAHSHKEQEEAYIVAGGSGQILLNDTVVELIKWDVIRVAPEVVRSFRAGSDGLEVIAVGGPKPADGDGVRQEPHWPSNDR